MTVFPVSRARIAGMVVYVATPLVPGLLSQGEWTALLWFAALPWLLDLIRRGAGLEAADPTAAADLVDGVAAVGLRRRARSIAFTAVVLALTAAFLPAAVALFLALATVAAIPSLPVALRTLTTNELRLGAGTTSGVQAGFGGSGVSQPRL